jgi:hypothetical protein
MTGTTGGTFTGYRLLGAACLAALLISGCGGSKPKVHHAQAASAPTSLATVCLPAARQTVARFFALPVRSVSVASSTGNNAEPQCSLRALRRGRPAVRVLANVSTASEPYFVLERTIVEASQIFTARRASPAPQAIPGLGIEASWFPEEMQAMTTDGVRLITVTPTWRHSTQAQKRSLSVAVARLYLTHPKNGAALAKGYP